MRASRCVLHAPALVLLTLAALLVLPAGLSAQEAILTVPPPQPPAPKIDGADTAFMMICAALVLLMTPGLGLFYGGMVRRKNVLATFQQSFIMLGVIALQWVLIGYSLAFGKDVGGLGLIGGLEFVGLRGVGLDPHPTYAPTIPHQLFMIYQLMFAVITPALISGAFAERMKFSAYLAFTLLWATFVYDPVAHWVWGGGWIGSKLEALDFAGGLVVHVISGVAALCAVIVMGRRKGLGEEEMHPHNLTMTAIGTALLWFGWFGFNAGSAFAADRVAVAAFVNTNLAVLGTCSGAVAGLVAITPAAGYVTPIGAVLIGLLVSFACYAAILLKGKMNYDDSLDVFGVHGVGGAFGAIAVGLFAVKGIGASKVDGLFAGSTIQLVKQVISLGAAAIYSFAVTFVILKVVDYLIGLRVTAEDEDMGLDLTQHGERGYIMGVGELMAGHGSSEPPRLADLARSVEEPVRI
jgi:Amt family ammonium transporter